MREFILSIINIIIIDVVLSGDNAIIIGMATKSLPEQLRKKAIVWGIGAATLFRIIFAVLATYLLQITGLTFVGGLLLIYVVWKFYKQLRMGDEEGHDLKQSDDLTNAIITIVVADISLSLDNVLAVAGTAKENMRALGFGLVVSVLLMAFASNWIAGKLNRYPQISWVGLLVILAVALGMLLEGSHELDNQLLHFNVLPFVVGLVGIGLVVLHDRMMPALEEEKIKNRVAHNYLGMMIGMMALVLVLVLFGHVIHDYVVGHMQLLLFVIILILAVIVELIALKGGWKKIFKR